MHLVDLETWPRRDHFRLFRSLEYPYFGVTVDLDVTGLLSALKAEGQPVYPSLIYWVTSVANEIEEFRLRIRGDQVVLHERVSPSFTVPWKKDLFNFCTAEFDPDREQFIRRCIEETAKAQAAETLVVDASGRDDLVFLTCFPWKAFTSVTHPVNPSGQDSFPRFAWGRITPRGDREVMPFNLQLHHGLADGLHAARFFERLEAVLAVSGVGRP